MLASRHFNGPICWNSMFLANVDCQMGPTNQSDFDKLSFDGHTSEILLVRPLSLICVYAAQEKGLNF